VVAPLAQAGAIGPLVRGFALEFAGPSEESIGRVGVPFFKGTCGPA